MGKNKTSLEKSHSKLSNSRLALICILISLSFVMLFVGLIYLKTKNIGYYILGGSGLLFLFSLYEHSKFKR